MDAQFVEYDVVRSTRSLSDVVPLGTRGAVLMVFPSAHPQYEVEFIDQEGKPVAVLTVHESDLELIERPTK